MWAFEQFEARNKKKNKIKTSHFVVVKESHFA